MPADKITLSRNDERHAFIDTYPKDILSFLWDALDYGELKEAGDGAQGTLKSFDQKEFYPSTLDWLTHPEL